MLPDIEEIGILIDGSTRSEVFAKQRMLESATGRLQCNRRPCCPISLTLIITLALKSALTYQFYSFLLFQSRYCPPLSKQAVLFAGIKFSNANFHGQYSDLL